MNAPLSGGKCTESLANYDPDSRSWKTCQTSLTEDSTEFAGRWPRSGMTRNGTLYPLPMWVRRTSAKESGLWRTPHAHCWKNASTMEERVSGGHTVNLQDQVRKWPTPTAMTGGTGVAPSHRNGSHGWNIGAAVQDSLSETPTRKWPTPTVQDSENDAGPSQWKRNSYPLNVEVHRANGRTATTKTGQLNPTWVEWLMGYPPGWTDLED